MSQNRVSAENASAKRSGTLKLYLTAPGQPQDAGTPADATSATAAPYARFRMCRGFLDDLNRMLPIRLRIQLETEIGKGHSRGRMEGNGPGFRWEFTEG